MLTPLAFDNFLALIIAASLILRVGYLACCRLVILALIYVYEEKRGKLVICAVEWGPLEDGVWRCKICQADSLDCKKLVKQLLAEHRGSKKKSEVQKPSLGLFFVINQDNKLHTGRQPISVKPQKVFELNVKKRSSELLPLHHFVWWQVHFSSSSERNWLDLPVTRLSVLFAGGFLKPAVGVLFLVCQLCWGH